MWEISQTKCGGARIVLQAVSLFLSLLALMEYVFVWRKDLEASIGSWVLGLFEGAVVITITIVIVLVSFSLKNKKETEKVDGYLV